MARQLPTHHQARRLAKIHTKKANPLFQGRLRYDLHALGAVGESFVNVELSFEELGVDYSGPVLVDRVSLAGSDEGVCYVDIDVRVIASDTYDWTIAEEGVRPVNPVPDTSEGIPEVTDFAAAAYGSTAGIAAAWSAASEALTPYIFYRLSRGGAWQRFDVDEGDSRVAITGLSYGVSYDLRIAWQSPNGVIGDYVALLGITAGTGTGAPSEPTGLAVTDIGGGQAEISVTASASSTNYRTLIFRDGAVVGQIVGAASASIVFTETPGVGTYSYTAQSEDVAGNVSSVVATTPGQTIIN